MIAELGYAAHRKYKTGEHDDDTELDKWMNTIKAHHWQIQSRTP